MKNHFLIKVKTGKVDENGFDIHEFAVTKYKYANVKVARKRLEAIMDVEKGALNDWGLTPCSKDWKN